MRLLSNIGMDRVVDHLPTKAALNGATNAASIQGLATLRHANGLRRLLLSSDTILREDADDRRRRNALVARGEGLKSLGWIDAAEVKVTALPLRQAVLLWGNATRGQAIIGDCEMTTAGLGLAPSRTTGMIQLLQGADEVAGVAAWFEQLWQRSESGSPDQLTVALREATTAFGAGTVYQRALAALFADMAADADALPDQRLGLEDSRVWQMLYRFQRDGVLGAINKLRQWGGCIIADSVGLGKTFEALAVIKYYELRNERALVLAPKRLRENWTLWTRNDVRNPLAGDRLAFDVLNHTDLSREGGLSGDIDLDHVNWGNYGLVVIDESHNFRNRPTGREGESRYDRLMRDIVKAASGPRC